jgi:hypothetical protein
LQGGFDAFGQRHDVILGFDQHRNSNNNRSLWPSVGRPTSSTGFHRRPRLSAG